MIRRLVFVLAALIESLSPPPLNSAARHRGSETIGAGRILVEGGVDWAHDAHFPASGSKAISCGCRPSVSASASARLQSSRSTAACTIACRSARATPPRRWRRSSPAPATRD